MAKRITPAKNDVKTPAKKLPANVETAEFAVTSPVRKTVAPKKSAAKAAASLSQPSVSYERIAERAYHISQSGYGGSQDDNWHRAERELRDGV